jgi:hypothetical protein
MSRFFVPYETNNEGDLVAEQVIRRASAFAAAQNRVAMRRDGRARENGDVDSKDEESFLSL